MLTNNLFLCLDLRHKNKIRLDCATSALPMRTNKVTAFLLPPTWCWTAEAMLKMADSELTNILVQS